MNAADRKRVLVAGIYLPDKENHAIAITRELVSSETWQVDLRWGAIGDNPAPIDLQPFTHLASSKYVPKFELINRLLLEIDLDDYEYLLITDDDIELPTGFLDAYLEVVSHRRFHLAQPARTHRSYIDHYFVAQLIGVEARRTRFIEIGPLFSVHRDAFPLLLPFDETAPMGWGLDCVWPAQMQNAGLTMGIVDVTPITHALRKPVTFYDYDQTNARMHKFLQDHEHLSAEYRLVSLESWPELPPTADK